jgi:hypothetical protein
MEEKWTNERDKKQQNTYGKDSDSDNSEVLLIG